MQKQTIGSEESKVSYLRFTIIFTHLKKIYFFTFEVFFSFTTKKIGRAREQL